MIPLVLSVLFGLGVGLLYDGLTRPPTLPDGMTPRLRRIRDFLIQAGLYDVSPRDFLLFSLGSGLALAIVVEVFLTWPLVSVPE